MYINGKIIYVNGKNIHVALSCMFKLLLQRNADEISYFIRITTSFPIQVAAKSTSGNEMGGGGGETRSQREGILTGRLTCKDRSRSRLSLRP